MMEKQFIAAGQMSRLEMFIDAILAIIITILVLEFKVPEEPFSSGKEVAEPV